MASVLEELVGTVIGLKKTKTTICGAASSAVCSIIFVCRPLATNISVLMHTASKTFTKGSAAANGALAQLMNVLHIAIEYEDITKESIVTKEFLTEAKASTGPHAEEVVVCVFPPRWRRGPRATWGR